MSQLDLAGEAEVSSRHLSFVETGRANPSRDMVLRLAERLEVPMRERNVLLIAAGYAPVFPQSELASPELTAVREAVEIILEGHKPYPAFALDRHWNIVASNNALPQLYEGVDPALLTAPVNVIRLSLHPGGLAPRIANLGEWRAHVLARLRRQVELTADPVLIELKAEAQAEMQKYRLGPLFTPPSLRGTLTKPGIIGGANWGGGAFDPDTGMLYIKTTNAAAVVRVKKTDHSSANPRASEVDAEWSGDLGAQATFHGRLPLTKPPYGHVTAIDLNHGTIAWQRPFGDWPELRNNPALKDVKLPAELGIAGPQGGVVTKGGLFFVGGEDMSLHAIDKTNGKDLWTGTLPARSYGTPMTYRTRSGRQVVVIAVGQGEGAALVAFALPEK